MTLREICEHYNLRLTNTFGFLDIETKKKHGPTPMKVLSLLHKNIGKFLSFEEISQEIWDETINRDRQRIIDVYICLLKPILKRGNIYTIRKKSEGINIIAGSNYISHNDYINLILTCQDCGEPIPVCRCTKDLEIND